MENKRIKIEIWSDFMCPFCYMGKHKLEAGLAKFEHKDEVDIVWRAFQLSPNFVTDTSMNMSEYISKRRDIPIEEAVEMNKNIEVKAKEVGLTYFMEKTVAANTLKAHQLSYFAKEHGKQTEAEEIIFRSFFTDGKNIDDESVLFQLAKELGLDENELKTVYENSKYVKEIESDMEKARSMGIKMIPCFVINDTKSISGTYDSETFYQALTETYAGINKEESFQPADDISGESCTIDGNCSQETS